jgi:drug/metabolite transporter (DMT)-like permease
MWIYFCLGAVLCWATANIVDKFLLSKWLKEPLLAVVIPAFLEVIIISLIYFLHGISSMPLLFIIFNIIAGILYILPIMFYLEALKKEEVTRVAPLFQISPLFVLMFAAIFLKENLDLIKYLGIALLAIGALALTLKDYKHLRINKSFLFMLLAAIALAANTILTKYLLSLTDIWTVYAYSRIGIAIIILPLFIFFWKKIKYLFKEYGFRRITAITGNYLLDIVGSLLITFALTYGSVILVSIFVMTKPFFVLLFSIAVCLFNIRVLKERFTLNNILLKSAAIALMFAGVILIL